MKRVVLIVTSLILLLAIPASVFLAMRNQELRKKAAPATTLSLTPATLTKNIGDEFTLEAKMNTGPNQIVAVELNIAYDATKLQAEFIHNGTMFPNILSSGTVNNGVASIQLGATNTTTPVTGTGTVATIKFKAIAATTAPITVRFGNNTFVGALGEGATNALTSSVPATITINSGSNNTNTTPTATPMRTPTPTGGTGNGNNTPTATPAITATPTGQSGNTQPTATPTTAADSQTSAITIDSPAANEAVDSIPTFEGTATPGSTVTLIIRSTEITVTVVADEEGNWSYTMPQALESGPHTVTAAVLDAGTGETHTATIAFVVSNGTENGADNSATPVAGAMENTLLLLGLGVLFIIGGAFAPLFKRN
jgi:hypothetical protein